MGGNWPRRATTALFASGTRPLVSPCAWSPDGRFIAAVGRDENIICVWDAQTGTEVARFEGDEQLPFNLVWATDGGFLAVSHTGGVDKAVVICFWDTRQLLPAQMVSA